MSIYEQYNKEIEELKENISNGSLKNEELEIMLEESIKNNLPVIREAINFYLDPKKRETATYQDFISMYSSFEQIYSMLTKIKDKKDLDLFYAKGKLIDGDKLRRMYFKQNLNKKFPKFKIDRYLELIDDPMLTVTNFQGEQVSFTKYWVQKNLIAINQMIFNEMDLYILNIGKEGSGKSCWSSQQILWYHTFLTEVGLIDYAFDITKMYFSDILSFLEEHQKQGKNDYFKIEVMDEGNDLNRGNFNDETNKQFKYEMRTERKMLRIVMINMQQIGELDTSISLSRVNFIYDCSMTAKQETGTLNKGFIDMYIIPRTNYIYSPVTKRNIPRNEILNAFANKLDKKKDYYISLPKEMIVNKFSFKNIWGFDKDKYDDHIKDEMKKHKFTNKMKLTELQAYILMTKMNNFIKLGTFDLRKNSDKKMYSGMNYLLKNIENFFKLHPEKLMIMEKYYDN